MSEAKVKVLNGGVTTQFDVKKLLEQFPTNPGDLIEHDDIARVIGAPWKSSRYGAVVTAWKKALVRERNVDVEAVPGVGYRVLKDVERMKSAGGNFVRGARQFKRADDKLTRVAAEKLPADARKSYDHLKQLATTMNEAAKKARKTFAARLGEYQSNPKPALKAVED